LSRFGKKPENAEQDAAHQRPRHAKAEIPENAKSPAVPLTIMPVAVPARMPTMIQTATRGRPISMAFLLC
jgi:hypothetical protein